MRHAALARRFLVEAGLRRARREHALHLGELDAARLQHNEQMVKQVRRLGDQVLAIIADRRERGLHRLLAELLGAMRHALLDQLAGVGLLGAFRRALMHPGFEIVQRERSHGT